MENSLASNHIGHRKRLDDKVIRGGFEFLSEHEQLEWLLYVTIPQKNTNEIAHKLIEKFGSITRVLGSDVEKLMEVDGIGRRTALFLSQIPTIFSIYARSFINNATIFDACEKVGRYFLTFFVDAKSEVLYALALTSSKKFLACEKIAIGSIARACVSMRKILEFSLKSDAYYIIIAHNHVSGNLKFSYSDIVTTKNIKAALEVADVTLLDHFLISGIKFISIKQQNIAF